MEYVNPYSLSYSQVNVLFLSGHDGFRLFAVLTIPVLYMNMRGRTKRMPGLVGTALGLALVLLLVWYQGTILRHNLRKTMPDFFHLDPPAEFSITPMLAFGKNDIVALVDIRNASSIQLFVIVACVIINICFALAFIYLSVYWLVMEFFRPAYPKTYARLMKTGRRVRERWSPSPSLDQQPLAEAARRPLPKETTVHSSKTRIAIDVFNGSLREPLPSRRAAPDGILNGTPESGFWCEG